ncbi:hypothetical protein GCM10027051_36640 [Niabella terrae]
MRNSVSCLLLFILLWGTACTRKWDDHIGLSDAGAQKTLYEILSANSEFSSFADMVDKAGYGDALQSSKNFTLIVPTNEALAAAKAQFDFSDSAVLRSFVGYHIINSVYNVNEGADTIWARNLRNKYVEFTHGEFDGIPAVQKNQVAGNGIYHVVQTALTPLQHIYALVTSRYPETLQAQTLLQYDTTTISSWLSEVRRPMITERSRYTYFVVDDAYFESEYELLSPLFFTHYDESTRDSTTEYFTRKALLKDMAVAGDLQLGSGTATLTSVSGTVFSVAAEDILSRQKASNGMVYRVRKLDCPLNSRIKEVKVLGTMPRGYKQDDKRGNIYFRDKRDTLGNLYSDIEIRDHGVRAFYVKYNAENMNALTYNVYGRAIMGLTGDPQTTAFTQYVHYFNPATIAANEPDLYNLPVTDSSGASMTRMPYDVQPLNHDEVFLGQVHMDEFGRLRLLVMANGTGPIILEYLRFVPQIP